MPHRKMQGNNILFRLYSIRGKCMNLILKPASSKTTETFMNINTMNQLCYIFCTFYYYCLYVVYETK